MSNAISSYARTWHIENPLSEYTISLLGVASNRIWNANVSSHPKLDASTRKDLISAIKTFRETNKAILEENRSHTDECFKSFSALGQDLYGNIWVNDEIFSKYYRAWKGAMVWLKLPVMLLPGWPPATKDGEAEYDYNRDLQEDVSAVMTHEGVRDPSASEEAIVLPPVFFPDNVSMEVESQLAIWICSYYNKYKDDNFESIMNPILKHTGLGIKVKADPLEINVEWISDEKLKEAEIQYVIDNRKTSDYFADYMAAVKDSPPDWVKEVEAILELASKADDEAAAEEEAGEGASKKASDPSTTPPAAEGARKIAAIVYKAFDPKLRKEITVNPAHKALHDIVPPAYMHIVDDKLIIRKVEPTVANVRMFIKENGLDETELDDASFAGIVVILASAGAIEANTDSAAIDGPGENVKSRVTAIKLASWDKAARRMLDASFAFSSQGAKDGELSWYDSFSAVYGRIMKARRFIQICELIMASGYLESYAKLTDIGTIRGVNNVIGYRLIRLSSPVLVMEAFRLVENATIYRMIDPSDLRDYVQFYQGGILAQIAAGPLKGYCKGDIDVLTTADIPSDVKIVELRAIDAAPYHERILRQAYIILEVYGRLPMRWYQGERAKRGMDARDTVFEAIVKAYKASERDAAEKQVKETNDLVIENLLGEGSLYDEVKAILRMKGPTI